MKRALVLRLSSFGDLVIAYDALSRSKMGNGDVGISWITAREGVPLLNALQAFRPLRHPMEVWGFDRDLGVTGWVQSCQQWLRQREFHTVVDLHNSLRTKVFRTLLACGFLKNRLADYRVQQVKKQRWRLWGLITFKGLWPKSLRPVPWKERHLAVLGGEVNGCSFPQGPLRVQGKFVCVAPSSKWNGKSWTTVGYAELIEGLFREGAIERVFILGRSDEPAVVNLAEALDTRGMGARSELFRPSGEYWGSCVELLRRARLVVANDSVFAHLAGFVGVATVVVYGPTRPTLGFQVSGLLPVLPVSERLWCAPCGKDGTRCIRPVRRHLCLKSLDGKKVLRACVELLRAQ